MNVMRLQLCSYKRLNTIISLVGGGRGAGGWCGGSFDYQLINTFSLIFFKNIKFYAMPFKAIIPIIG